MREFGFALCNGSHLLAVGAHPDDVEIGCGATLLTLAAAGVSLTVDVFVATGDDARQQEARQAAELFLPGMTVRHHHLGLPDGRLPGAWTALKDGLEAVRAVAGDPDVILSPSADDAHQDHRLLAEMIPTVWRDHTVLEYEIPKWDGDLAHPSVYVPFGPDVMREKVERLRTSFPSQEHHDWWDDDVFRGLPRLRGMECRAPFAEAFTCRKAVIGFRGAQ